MIIDAHAHYAHRRYDNSFLYLDIQNGTYAIARGERQELVEHLRDNGIIGWIEPSIAFECLEKQLETGRTFPDSSWTALGVHPTRCIKTSLGNRKKLKYLAEHNNIIAIGETGLDYHHPRKEQHRLKQKIWFRYQLRLADRLNLPLILHIRMADRDALKILKRYRKRLHGGVVHCFSGEYHRAQVYLDLGFTLGIGGTLLRSDEVGKQLQDTVRRVPLSSLLVETDAPYVLPELDTLECSGKQRKKLCNSSMILRPVIDKIAEIRDEDPEVVENVIYQNTLRTFHL